MLVYYHISVFTKAVYTYLEKKGADAETLHAFKEETVKDRKRWAASLTLTIGLGQQMYSSREALIRRVIICSSRRTIVSEPLITSMSELDSGFEGRAGGGGGRRWEEVALGVLGPSCRTRRNAISAIILCHASCKLRREMAIESFSPEFSAITSDRSRSVGSVPSFVARWLTGS